MQAPSQKLSPPQPQDFGLDLADVSGDGFETIKLGGVSIPKSLSPALNWGLGLSVAVPLALWTVWGLVERIDSQLMGIVFGVFSGIVVFQLAVSVVPLCIEVGLRGLGLLVDEISSYFSDKARAKIAYRKALHAYRDELARGGYDR